MKAPSVLGQLRLWRAAAVAVGLLLAMAAARADDATGPLHRASPDWRDQVLYFALTDRFDNGNPANDDQGAGEFDPGRPDRYSGGDLAGALRRLEYLQGLGVTGLWLTPWVTNQWLDGAGPDGGHAGYHGYWASDFSRVDPHVGTLADLQRLSRGLHARGMVLVQDIVVNHVGNYFDLAAEPDPADADAAARLWRTRPGSRPTTAPTQPPFDRNDARRAADRAAAIYHWTPAVADYGDRRQELGFQMSGLDDLNTENPVVRRALRRSYGQWIRDAGVDGFRVDTAFYVPPDFFTDFLHADDPGASGILALAAATGRRDFHVFGEGFGIDRAFDDRQARRIESYMTASDGRPILPGMLNFPLYGALNDVFARGRPPAELAWRIRRTMQLHARPHRLPSFVDNHDVDRFLAAGDETGLRQALLAMFTLPGIPVIYQGTEQGFRAPRAAMFAAGWGAGGRDHFDTTAPLYRTIARLAALRREHRTLSRGTPTVLHADTAGAGVIAWRMDQPGPEGEPLLVAINSARREALVERLEVGPGTRLQPLFALEGEAPAMAADADGTLTLRLPAGAAGVWRLRPGAPAAAVAAVAAPTLDSQVAPTTPGDFEVRGRARVGQRLQLVIDGDLAAAQALTAGTDGRWAASVDTGDMVDPARAHRVAVWAPDDARASPAQAFRVERPWRLLADVDDPAGDDHGPDGRYRYPLDPSWGPHRQLDLRRVRAYGSGGALRLVLGMHALTRSWNPAQGFDHVAFTIFIELPGEPGGSTVMPGQDGRLPDGMRWHRRLRLHGWSNGLFSAEGASAEAEGRPTTPAAALTVDEATQTLQLTLAPAALGHRRDLAGLRLWVTTWDWDGGYRALQAEPGPHAFGGPPGGPRVMDSSPVITLP